MNFLLQPKPRKNISFQRARIIVGSIVVLVIVMEVIFPNMWSNFTVLIAKPFWKSREAVANVFLGSNFLATRSSLQKENQLLRDENEKLREKMNDIDILMADNSTFRNTLGLEGAVRTNTYSVIVHPSQTPYDVLVLEPKSGITPQVGQRVVLGNVALGTVVQSDSLFVKVDMYSSKGREIEGRLLPGGEPLILTGKGAGNFAVKVPRDMEVVVGQLVVLPGDPAFAIARIASIEESEKDSFKQLRLISPKNIFSLRFVEIIEQ